MDALPGALREDVPKPTTADFLVASLPAQPSEASLQAQPSRATAPLPPGQGSTALPQVDNHYQHDEQTNLDNDGPARGATPGGDTHGAIARSGDTDGLAAALGATVDEQGKSDSGETVPRLPVPVRSVANSSRTSGSFRNHPQPIDEDALSATLRKLGSVPALSLGNVQPDAPMVAQEQKTRLVQPDAQAENNQNVQPDAHLPKSKQKKRLHPPTISGHGWKPSGLTGWELYRRKPAISAKGKRSSKQEYIAYYSQKAVERLHNAKRKKTPHA